jgi:ABC-2 type transport system permease protein
MKNIAAIAMKELYTYFVSPVAYFVFFIFTAVSGFFFYFIFFNVVHSQRQSDVVMESLFPTMGVILLFFTPALTMKLVAEERKTGTIELMSTSPVTDTEMVLGKYVASLVLTLAMLLLTLLFPTLIAAFGEIDTGSIASGYLGIILLASTFLSIGLLISSMCKNQIVAALTSFGILLALWIIGFLSNSAGQFGEFLAYLSLTEHFQDFARGVVGVKHVVYFLSFTTVCLFATVKSVESSKWR